MKWGVGRIQSTWRSEWSEGRHFAIIVSEFLPTNDINRRILIDDIRRLSHGIPAKVINHVPHGLPLLLERYKIRVMLPTILIQLQR